MIISRFLIEFWGWFLIRFFVVLSFNPKRINQIFDDLVDQKLLPLASFMAIITGLIHILIHNIWEAHSKLTLTLIGWMSLFISLALFIMLRLTIAFLLVTYIKFVQIIYSSLFFTGLFLQNERHILLLNSRNRQHSYLFKDNYI